MTERETAQKADPAAKAGGKDGLLPVKNGASPKRQAGQKVKSQGTEGAATAGPQGEAAVEEARQGGPKGPATGKATVVEGVAEEQERAQKEARFLKAFQYVTDHMAFFSVAVTLLTGLFYAFLKALAYCFLVGRFDYFDISHTYIDIASENGLYELFLALALALLFIALNLSLYLTVRKKSFRLLKLFFFYLVITMLSSLCLSFWLLPSVTVSGPFLTRFIAACVVFAVSFIIAFPLGVLLTGPGLLEGLTERLRKKERPSKRYWHQFFSFPNLLIVLFCAVSLLLFSRFIGAMDAQTKRTFKAYDSHHVVLYEDEAHFLLAESGDTSDTSTLTIYTQRQKLVEKAGAETTLRTYESVTKGSL